MKTAVIVGRNSANDIPGRIHSWHETVEAARAAAKPLGGTTRSIELILAYPEKYGSDPLFPSQPM